jgi:tetratricopeptide (TPR) repeat protein
MYEEGEVEYLRAIALEPKNADFHNGLAILYGDKGDVDKAIESYQKAVELKPNHVYYLSLGIAYEKRGKVEEAIKAYQESIKIKPTFTYALYNLGASISGRAALRKRSNCCARLSRKNPQTHSPITHSAWHMSTSATRPEDAAVLRSQGPQPKRCRRFVKSDSEVGAGWS